MLPNLPRAKLGGMIFAYDTDILHLTRSPRAGLGTEPHSESLVRDVQYRGVRPSVNGYF